MVAERSVGNISW